MIVLGVTGGFGTGKTTVATMLKRLGATVIDTDRVARDVVAPGQPAWRAIRRRWGAAVLRRDRTLNRAALARRVFHDADARAALERIIHPQVIRAVRRRLRELKRQGRARVVAVDVPLLLETGLQSLVDAVVVVAAPRGVLRRRLHQKGFSDAEIDRRCAAQWDLSAKVALADHVVDNGRGVEQTRRQVRQLWKQLQATKRTPRG